MSKVNISSIQVQFPDGEIKQMSLDDAKALFEQLKDLFGSKTVVMPSPPVIVEKDRYWPQPRPLIQWEASKPEVRDPLPEEAPDVWCDLYCMSSGNSGVL